MGKKFPENLAIDRTGEAGYIRQKAPAAVVRPRVAFTGGIRP